MIDFNVTNGSFYVSDGFLNWLNSGTLNTVGAPMLNIALDRVSDTHTHRRAGMLFDHRGFIFHVDKFGTCEQMCWSNRHSRNHAVTMNTFVAVMAAGGERTVCWCGPV